MRTYVADFIPRFRQFSKKLDAGSLLINQHWVVVDEINSSKTMYIFQRRIKLINKSPNLVVSKDGLVEKGFWELLDPETLLITLGEKSFLFKHGFLDENVLALKLDGKDEYAMFFNESRIDGELNSLSSMKDFLELKYPISDPPVVQSKSTQSVSVEDIDPDISADNKIAALCCVAIIIIIVIVGLTGGID